MAEPRENVSAPRAGAAEGVALAQGPRPEDLEVPLPGEAAAAPNGERRSLLDDVEALIDDARTYLDAELSYQKTRAAFVTDRVKKAIAYAAVAAVVALLAAIGLTVGLIIALTPLLTGWGATALVVGVMLLATVLLLRRAARNWNGAMGAVRSDDQQVGSEG